MPEAASLASIRDEIDREPLNFKNVLTEPNLSRMFFPHARKQSEVVSAFVKGSSDNALKTKPKVNALFPWTFSWQLFRIDGMRESIVSVYSFGSSHRKNKLKREQ